MKMSRRHKWYVRNLPLLAAVAWATGGMAPQGVHHLIVVFIWTALVGCVARYATIHVEMDEDKLLRAATVPVPKWMDISFDVIMCLLLVWYGWFWTYGAYMGILTTHYATLDAARKRLRTLKEIDNDA